MHILHGTQFFSFFPSKDRGGVHYARYTILFRNFQSKPGVCIMHEIVFSFFPSKNRDMHHARSILFFFFPMKDRGVIIQETQFYFVIPNQSQGCALYTRYSFFVFPNHYVRNIQGTLYMSKYVYHM